ncbi:ABC transporter permease [Kitasatospora sp. CM 4170]|uniref:ABC transporter permease n=1 Tax=Kitasatospora aburaviensis TaxID=67265 RepID=A0ABW1EUV5_9ACTN|nr:ABC transporter permease [Kitasatospora sp. CM 4170]WNM45950.1 ABC transporter permease [Kitasatospora sp. CM 4170]
MADTVRSEALAAGKPVAGAPATGAGHAGAAGRPVTVATEPLTARVRWAFGSWWLVAAMWQRSTMAYRLSFALMAVASTVVTFLDFVVVLLMFRHTSALGGWTLPELGFLYGTSSFALGTANLLVGTADALGERIRTGSLDTMLIRPAPALAQLCAERFTLRRLGRPLQGAGVLVWSLTALDVHWTWDKALLVPVLLVCGSAIFAAVFIGGATVQFWWGEAGELQNSLTYGGATLLQYPPTIFARELVAGVVFGVPLAFVNWLPALRILDRPDPLGLPAAFQYASPVAAVLCCTAAGLAWRAGLRAYRGTGS